MHTSVMMGVLPIAAHVGAPLAPHDLPGAWSLEPGVLVPLALTAWFYARGTRRLWGNAGEGHGLRRWQRNAFVAGVAALVIALVSPLDAMGGVLFSAHMTQHEVLMLVAAPLLVLGAPVVPFLWALPARGRRALVGITRAPVVRRPWQALVHPCSAWVLQAAAVWIWHAPSLYDRTVSSEPIHVLQHMCFLGSAILYWESLVGLMRRGRAGYPIGILSLFTTATYGGVLGALLTFSPRPWYPAYATTTLVWGLTPLEDQQLGGLIMWVPFGFVHLIAAAAVFLLWMRAMDKRDHLRPEIGAERPAAPVPP